MASFPAIALIGAGNMGGALIGGLVRSGHPVQQLWAADPCQERLAALSKQTGIQTTTDNHEAAALADVVIFAVKPQLFLQTAKALAPVVEKGRPLVMSVAAGIQTRHIEQWLGGERAIVRAMPNLPALIGEGATALYANQAVTNHNKQIAENIMRTLGIVKWVPAETLMDSITALSGSGPAYFFLIMEALEKAALDLGLSQDIAHVFTLHTVRGAADMAIKTNTPLAKLREQVTSKGGTTERGIAVLEENNIRSILEKTLQAAKLRAEELAQQPGD